MRARVCVWERHLETPVCWDLSLHRQGNPMAIGIGITISYLRYYRVRIITKKICIFSGAKSIVLTCMRGRVCVWERHLVTPVCWDLSLYHQGNPIAIGIGITISYLITYRVPIITKKMNYLRCNIYGTHLYQSESLCLRETPRNNCLLWWRLLT